MMCKNSLAYNNTETVYTIRNTKPEKMADDTTAEYDAARKVAAEMVEEKALPPPINTRRRVPSSSSGGVGATDAKKAGSGGYLDKQLKKKRGKFGPISAGVEAGGAAGGRSTHIIPKGDIRRVPKQNYLVLSYATPDGTTVVRSPRGMVMKFSGAFDTLPEAEKHAEAIRNEDPRFNVFVVDLYKWGVVPLPKDEEPFISRKYADEMLTRIVGGLQASMEQGKKEMVCYTWICFHAHILTITHRKSARRTTARRQRMPCAPPSRTPAT